jgi:hypothetical protein
MSAPPQKGGDSPLSRQPSLKEIRLSYGLRIGRVTTSPVQNDSDGVSIGRQHRPFLAGLNTESSWEVNR